jgi:hypothetical protein
MTIKEDKLITSRAMRELFGGVSLMTLYRWRKDPKLNFPEPVKIRDRNYWAYEQALETKRRLFAARKLRRLGDAGGRS